MKKKKVGVDGNRLYKLRTEAKLLQSELVAAVEKYGVKMGQSHYSGMERGVAQASIEVLVALAFVLDTTTDYLIGLTDDPSPRPDLEEQIILVETDPVRREYMQRMFTAIERMPVDRRDKLWNLISTLYAGIMAEGIKSPRIPNNFP